MLVSVAINQDDLLNQFAMSKKECEDIVDFAIKNLAAKCMEIWISEAQLHLHSTRDRYLANLNLIDEGRMSGTIVLDYSKDPLVKMLEEGATAFDMKEGFEKSDKVKFSKLGKWYLTIPLKLGAPDTIGDSVGGITNIPQSVYAVIKKQPINSNTNRSAGLKEQQIPEAFQAPASRAAISGMKSDIFEKYQHKSGLFEGAFKQKDTTTGQNTYGNFRRVGEASDAKAFIHPGLENLNLAEKALEKLNQVMDIELTRSLDVALANAGFE